MPAASFLHPLWKSQPMLDTEKRNPRTLLLDRMSSEEMVSVFQEENRVAVEALTPALPSIARAIDAAASALTDGGRILYVGCGTSGRLAAQDAAECPPTYGTAPEQVVAVLAGGASALVKASEGAEDSAEDGAKAIRENGVCAKDIVIGISASGGAAYVLGALRAAHAAGATTVSVTSNADAPISAASDIVIYTPTGPEPVTGSTRMKAGTAQKLVLNMISTGAMVKTGHVISNLMVNLKPTNRKLRARMIRIVSVLADCPEAIAERRLEQRNWSIRSVLAEGS